MSRNIIRLFESSEDGDASADASTDASDRVGERSMDRRTYLQAAGGLATLGVGDEVSDLAFDSTSPQVASVNEPEVFGYGGSTALADGGTAVAPVTAGPDTAAAHVRAPSVSRGKQVHAELESGSSDWYVFQADRADPIDLSFDRADPVRATALFLYGPDGSLREYTSAGGDRTRVHLGVADRSGPHFLQAVDLGGGDGAYSLSVHAPETADAGTLTAAAGEQSPYNGSPQPIPGTVQAQKFDEGGEGVAYHDETKSNQGGAFRTDEAVDIAQADDASGEYNVGYPRTGEWLEYTVDVTSGTYNLHARVASNNGGGELEVSLDGETLGTVEVPDTGGWQRWETVTIEDVSVDVDGEAILRVDMLTKGFNLNYLRFAGQRPYGGSPQTVPGTVQAQKFDEGGEGIAYHDTTASNQGGAFRTDEAVDIAQADDASGEYNVGYVKAGEWLEYTVDVTSGTYSLSARVASNAGGGEFEVSLDGTTLGTVTVPDTGGWQRWETVTIEDVSVDVDGEAILRVDALTDGFNLNCLEFVGQRPYGGSPQTIPGKVQAEKYDEGGEGVAYSDTTASNLGGAFRPDEAVDVASADDGTNEFNVGYPEAGEWLEYTVDVSSGTYALDARVASNAGGGEFEVSLDGTTLGTVTVPDTGGWQRWETVTLDAVPVETSGRAILRIEALTDGFNLNWIGFQATSDEEDDYGELTYGLDGYGN